MEDMWSVHEAPARPPAPARAPSLSVSQTAAAAVIAAGACVRALTRHQTDATFLLVSVGVLACALAALLPERWAPAWVRRRRGGVAIALRLVVALLGGVCFPIPEPPTPACPGYLWLWLTNSGAMAAFYCSLAFAQPSKRDNLLLGLVQLASLGWMACVRCGGLGAAAPPGVSLLEADPGRCLTPVAQVLDWPFHLTFPHIMHDAAVALSPQATCLACTLWAQAVGGLLAPAILLHTVGGEQQRQQQQRQQQRDRERGDDREGDSWLDLLRNSPLLALFYSSNLLWVLLRAACAMWLPTTATSAAE